MMQKILVPVRGDGKGDNVFAHAVALAKPFHAHIVVAHFRTRPQDMIPFGVAVPAGLRDQIITQSTEIYNQVEAGIRGEIEALCEKHGAQLSDVPLADTVSVGFIEEEGRQIDVIKHHGLVSDLTAVAQPDRDRNIGTNTLQAALFSTGRPVLMCPERDDAMPQDFGASISIAWDGSVQASRAVAQSMPFLLTAKEVNIITVEEAGIKTTPQDLAGYLAGQGISASISVLRESLNIGLSILENAQSLGSHILVLGAYGTSKNYERVAGGVTQYMIDHSTMPIMFVS